MVAVRSAQVGQAALQDARGPHTPACMPRGRRLPKCANVVAALTRAAGLHARRAISRNSVPARTARRSAGFTLLEMMITLVVLAIGVLALGQMMPAGSRSMNRSRSTTTGTTLAAQKLEDLKSSPWTSAALTAGTYTDRSGKYTRSWTITDNTPLSGTKKISVTTSWTSSQGTRSTVLNTYLTQLAN